MTISVAFGCPFEGAVDPARVLGLAEEVASSGADEIVLADTIGVAVPSRVTALVRGRARVRRAGRHPPPQHALHGLRERVGALEAGATIFDASVGGLGGCPFAPRATGNIATEDLVYLLHGEGVETGIDLDALIAVAAWLGDGGPRPASSPARSTAPAPSLPASGGGESI